MRPIRPWRLTVSTTLTLLVVFVSLADGQAVSGNVVGTVTDTSDARLPGVLVTISGPALIRGQETTRTAADGSYRFTTLPPAVYTLTFELEGFQSVRREGIRVEAGQTFAVDVVAQVGQVQQAVTVVGGAPLIDVKGAQVGHTIDANLAENLPVTRRFSDLLNTLPGVTDGLYSFSPVNTVYGSSVRENVYTVDGLNFVDPLVRRRHRRALRRCPGGTGDDRRLQRSLRSGHRRNLQLRHQVRGNSFRGTANFHIQHK